MSFAALRKLRKDMCQVDSAVFDQFETQCQEYLSACQKGRGCLPPSLTCAFWLDMLVCRHPATRYIVEYTSGHCCFTANLLTMARVARFITKSKTQVYVKCAKAVLAKLLRRCCGCGLRHNGKFWLEPSKHKAPQYARHIRLYRYLYSVVERTGGVVSTDQLSALSNMFENIS
jgi:hypothetical protein